MFSRITGAVVDQTGDLVRIDVAGLVYDVLVPPSVAAKVPSAGETTLEIYPHFALDGNAGRFTFFGFTNAMERIARAIDEGDHVFLRTLPGIGQQKARDIVAKLQGKVTRFLLIQDAPARAVTESPPMPEFAGEALAVLL